MFKLAPARAGSHASICLLTTLAALIAFAASANAATNTDELKNVPQLIREGNLGRAEQIIDRTLAAKPRDAAARFQKSIVLTRRGKTDEAIVLLQELVADYPELPEPYNNLATLYAVQGRYDDARRLLETALANDPNNAIAHENLGDLYLKLADAEYEKAAKADPNNAELRAKRAAVREQHPAAVKPSAAVTPPAAASKPASH
jgi:Flp pilus assembly protein TadD